MPAPPTNPQPLPTNPYRPNPTTPVSPPITLVPTLPIDPDISYLPGACALLHPNSCVACCNNSSGNGLEPTGYPGNWLAECFAACSLIVPDPLPDLLPPWRKGEPPPEGFDPENPLHWWELILILEPGCATAINSARYLGELGCQDLVGCLFGNGTAKQAWAITNCCTLPTDAQRMRCLFTYLYGQRLIPLGQ